MDPRKANTNGQHRLGNNNDKHRWPRQENVTVRRGRIQRDFNRYEDRGLGIIGLIKALLGKPEFTGHWDEDLESTIGAFETMERMCTVTKLQVLSSISFMLNEDGLSYF